MTFEEIKEARSDTLKSLGIPLDFIDFDADNGLNKLPPNKGLSKKVRRTQREAFKELDISISEGEKTMTFEEARELWMSNIPHTTAEEIEGFPTGNVFIGMTYEDFCKLNEYFRIGGDNV